MSILAALFFGIGGIAWAFAGNPWLALMFGVNTGIFVSLAINKEA